MNNFKPHIISIVVFLIISIVYCSSIFEKDTVLHTPDIQKYIGMSKEVVDHRNNNGEEALWTGTSFSGMPAYQTGLKSENNLIQYIHKIIHLGLPRPIDIIFMYLFGFYILLISLKVDYRIAIIGSIGFAFSSYFFIIIQAGHMTKAHAISYLPLIIAAVIYTYRNKKWVLGAVFTSLFLALQLYANHYQITYYTILILFFIALLEFIRYFKDKKLIDFSKKSGVLVLAGVLALGTNYTRLATTMEYSPISQRGKSELNNNKKKDRSWGFDYITSYSYGKSETMTFLIPNFKGGSMGPNLLNDNTSKTFSTQKFRRESTKWENAQIKFKEQEQAYQKSKKGKIATSNFKVAKDSFYIAQDKYQKFISSTSNYWGENNIEEQKFGPGAPTYVGSIIVFLFILGILYVNSQHKIWILIVTVLSIMLAWGHNFPDFSRFFIDYFPGYGKFRAITMIMIISQFGIALLAILALNKLLKEGSSIEKEKKLKMSFYLVGGVTLLFALIPESFISFLSEKNKGITDNEFLFAVVHDRSEILKADAWRSLIYITLSAVTLWLFIRKKIKQEFVIIIVGLLILVDLWNIDKRYLNDSHFNNSQELQEKGLFLNDDRLSFIPLPADKEIKQNNLNNSRVYKEPNAFSESRTSYFHRSIGGYSSAKIKRYQDVYDMYIKPEIDTIDIAGNPIRRATDAPYRNRILGMLNCGWVIDNNNQAIPSKSRGIDSLGNAWFVSNFKSVENADAEFNALSDPNINLKSTVIVNQEFKELLSDFDYNPNAKIKLNVQDYKPNHLIYSLKNITSNHLVVFSEIYYKKGWNAYIDGKKVPYFRGNYILRAMIIPKGTEKIEFKFEPSSYYTGESLAMVSSIILLLLLGFISYKEFRYHR